MKNKYLALFIIPFLSACNTYRGVMYELKYDENASLKEVNPIDMYNSAVNKVDSVYLIGGLKDCSSCLKAKEETEAFISKKHVNIYYIDINKVTFSSDPENLKDTDYEYLYQATVYANDGEEDYNSLPKPETAKKELALPVFLFFKYGAVGTKVTTDYSSSLNRFIKVIK